MTDGEDYQKLLDIERAERDRQRIMRLDMARAYGLALNKLSEEVGRLTRIINKFRDTLPLPEDDNGK